MSELQRSWMVDCRFGCRCLAQLQADGQTSAGPRRRSSVARASYLEMHRCRIREDREGRIPQALGNHAACWLATGQRCPIAVLYNV